MIDFYANGNGPLFVVAVLIAIAGVWFLERTPWDPLADVHPGCPLNVLPRRS